MASHGLTLSEVAVFVSKLKMYPYFDIANYILMTMMVREDTHPPPSSGRPTLYSTQLCGKKAPSKVFLPFLSNRLKFQRKMLNPSSV